MKKRLKKLVKIFGFLLLATITLFALWTAWENWTGAREWKETQEMLVEEGIELDFKKLMPVMPSEDRNFARTPLIAAVTDFKTGQPDNTIIYENPQLAERFQEIRLPDLGKIDPFPSWKSGTPAELAEVQKVIAEETGGDGDILAWMNQFEPELAEIDAAAQLPGNQMQVRMGDTFIDLASMSLPFFQDFRQTQKLQAIRACAALRAGDNPQARAALHTSLQLQRTSMSHPSLIAHLVGVVMLDQSLSVIWEGLEANLWTGEDLQWIRDQLADQTVLPQLEEAMVFEMVAFQIGAGTFMKSISASDARQLVSYIGEMGGAPTKPSSWGLLALIVPTGIWDHNLAYGARAMFEEGIQPVRERRLPDPTKSWHKTDSRNLHNFLSHISFPANSVAISRSFERAVAVDLARIACAVELYRMEHGDYPPSADALVPEFIDKIPEDIFNPGNPLKYKKGAQGDRYRIYSIGKNGTDDDGEVVYKPNTNRHQDLEKGDWAWGYEFSGANR